MRTIKFRAWDEKTKTMFNIARFDFADYTVYSHLFACEGYLGESLHVMQFTGLMDTEHNEVYENDIIEDDLEYLAVVKFGEHLTSTDYYASTAYGWYAERVNGDTHSLAQCGTIAVRGNIHEHPHLLEQTDE